MCPRCGRNLPAYQQSCVLYPHQNWYCEPCPGAEEAAVRIDDLVLGLRAAGHTWAEIGRRIRLSTSGARARYDAAEQRRARRHTRRKQQLSAAAVELPVTSSPPR